MVAEVFAGLTAFKTMFDIAKAMKDMDDAVKRNAAVADLGEQIIAAQTRYSAAVEQIRELEEQVTKFKTWESEKKRYKLTDFGAGTFAYLLKPDAANGEPPHRICASCYQKGVKSILQFLHRSEGQDYYKCENCGELAFGMYVSRNTGSIESDYDPFWNDDGTPRR